MTNTRITDIEIAERNFPVLVNHFKVRKNSGGKGEWRGGEGIVIEYTALIDMQVSELCER